jgi:lipopolysaccharide export system protein LptA
MAVALVAALPAHAADTRPGGLVPVTAPDTSLPIELKASFSEFDRRANRLMFRGLEISQGTLFIKADQASADPADFVNSTWVFRGNVEFRNADTAATGDQAKLSFRDNGLLKAMLTGKPATFSQPRTGKQTPARGEASTVEYTLADSTVRLSGGALVSDGTNEVRGTAIAYDLQRQVVTANAGDDGRVRMTIQPPARKTREQP